MNKKYNILLIIVCLIAFVSSGIISFSNSIVTQRQNYLIEASDSNSGVSTRELALLAALAYEDIPDDSRYQDKPTLGLINWFKELFGNKTLNFSKTSGTGCIENDKLTKDCFFTEVPNRKVALKNSKYLIEQYIEGLSQRKKNSIVSTITLANVEKGQKYYYLDFADVKELEDSGWVIYDYETTRPKEANPDNINFNDYFDVITFKKNDNYVIAYRGTDFPDFLEWLDDIVVYGLTGVHTQADNAYEYAQKVYEKIIKENSNAKVYVTGHSLGAYLAQIGGAAIVDYEAGRTNPTTDEVIQSSNIEKYTDTYHAYNSKLEQVAYFNGMSVTGLFDSIFESSSAKFKQNVANALIYLSTHDKFGNIANSGRTINYSDKLNSSGRLVLYSMDSDPISAIGVHYGEIYKLEVAADAITNHVDSHNLLNIKLENDPKLDELIKKISNGSATVAEEEEYYNSVNEQVLSSYDINIDEVSNNLYATIIVENNNSVSISKTDTESGVVPYFVANTISVEKGINLNKFLKIGFSTLKNLSKDSKQFYDKYKIGLLHPNGGILANTIEYFNINHETDSFACLINNDKGTFNEDDVDLKITKVYKETNKDEVNINIGNSLYIQKFDDFYKIPYTYDLGEKIDNRVGQYQYLILSAEVKGACVKEYEWQYKIGEGTWQNIGVTTNNEIIIPKEILSLDPNTKKDLEFKVNLYYGDNYYETKMKLDGSNVSYEKSTSYIHSNPTFDKIENNLDPNKKHEVVSKTTKLTIVSDTVAPVCNFKYYVHGGLKPIYDNTTNITVSKATFKDFEMHLYCTDNLSGFNYSKRELEEKYETYFSLESNKVLGVKEKLKYVGLDYISKSSNSLSIELYYKLNGSSAVAAQFKHSGGIKDRSGNVSATGKTYKIKVTD